MTAPRRWWVRMTNHRGAQVHYTPTTENSLKAAYRLGLILSLPGDAAKPLVYWDVAERGPFRGTA